MLSSMLTFPEDKNTDHNNLDRSPQEQKLHYEPQTLTEDNKQMKKNQRKKDIGDLKERTKTKPEDDLIPLIIRLKRLVDEEELQKKIVELTGKRAEKKSVFNFSISVKLSQLNRLDDFDEIDFYAGPGAPSYIN
jgi:hypothetical protein